MNELKNKFIFELMRFNRRDIIRENKVDLSKSEIALLFNLYFKKECNCAKDLVKELNFSKSMITTMLNNLEDKEYIIKEFDNKDRRKINIIITKKGNNFVKSSIHNMDKKIDSIICKLGNLETEKFISLMSSIMEVLDND